MYGICASFRTALPPQRRPSLPRGPKLHRYCVVFVRERQYILENTQRNIPLNLWTVGPVRISSVKNASAPKAQFTDSNLVGRANWDNDFMSLDHSNATPRR